MYSHYRSYQHQHGNNAGGIGVAAAQQPGMTWNGSAWVPMPGAGGAAATSSTFSTYSSNSSIPPNAVELYTNYYHGWNGKYQKQQKVMSILPVGSPDRATAEMQLRWYKYYADESSRAAHHFHGNPNVPAPFDLPPDPATTHRVGAAAMTSSKAQQQQQQAPTEQQFSQLQQQSPDTLNRYVDRCLSQCNNADEKIGMTKEIEKLIQKAVKDGSLHSTNWDVIALIPLALVRNGGDDDYYRRSSAGNLIAKEGYYGPAAAGSSKKRKTAKHSSAAEGYRHVAAAVADSGDYYGPASTHISSQNDSHGDDEDFIAFSIKKQRSGFNESTKAKKDRAMRFSGPGGITDASLARAKPLQGLERYMGKSTIGGGGVTKLDETDFENMKVKGTNTTLAKDYLRLTAPPRPELVRPQYILEKHLYNLKQGRKQESPRHDYLWFCSQLKAVRQDCTVQHLQNGFSVDVYETHARIALEEGDLNEYNQCQTQLKELYKLLSDDEAALSNRAEFLAYRILYYIFLSGNKQYDGGSSDLFKLMLSLTAKERSDVAIRHALQVRTAVADMNFHRFFRLLRECPNLGLHLLERIAPGVRYNALQRICKSYRPDVPVSFVLSELGFEDRDSGLLWLTSCGCVLDEKREVWKAKESVVHESNLEEKKSLI